MVTGPWSRDCLRVKGHDRGSERSETSPGIQSARVCAFGDNLGRSLLILLFFFLSGGTSCAAAPGDLRRPAGGLCWSLAALGHCKHTMMPVPMLSGRVGVVYTCPHHEERRGTESISYSIFISGAVYSCFLIRSACKQDALFFLEFYITCKGEEHTYMASCTAFTRPQG